jgi:hypothetical protein
MKCSVHAIALLLVATLTLSNLAIAYSRAPVLAKAAEGNQLIEVPPIEDPPHAPTACLLYRNTYSQGPLHPKAFQLSSTEKKEGFTILFDGTNLDHWRGNLTDYTLEAGTIAVKPKPGAHGNLYTKEEYSDFVFRFEFKLTPGANNGLGIRAPLEGDAAYTGMELQILDNEAEQYKDLKEYQYHGSVYGVLPAKRGYLKPVGEWNQQEVIVQGPKIKVILNGTTILDGDLTDARKNGTLDEKAHPGIQREKGHIGFLGHGSELWLRNIRIKDLNKEKDLSKEK